MGTRTPDRRTAPSDYGQLYTEYFDYIKLLVQNYGIQEWNAEDVADEILLKFYEKGFLEKFDPEFTAEVGGRRRRSSFTGFLSGFTWKYTLAYRDQQMTRMRREPHHLQDRVGEDGEWGDIYLPSSDDGTNVVDTVDLIERGRAYLATLPIRGTRDLPRVFEMCERMMVEDGAIDRHKIAEALDVSPTAVCLIMKDLRAALVDAGVR
jgi:DNA-directed RNA polymerase specialized sigma24 family protein